MNYREKMRKAIECPQFGNIDYGEWGTLRLDQRKNIKRLLDEMDRADAYIRQLYEENKKFNKWIETLNKENHRLNNIINELEKDNKNLYKIICKNCGDLKTTDEEYESLKRVQKLKENKNG